jgi:transcriptional regulator with XRE-family HTH domain
MTESKQLMQRIEQRIAALGISRRSAAVRAGLSENALNVMRSKIDSGGHHRPRVDTIRALAPVLHTTVEWLLDGKGPEVVMPDTLPAAPQPTKRPKNARGDIDAHMDAIVGAVFAVGVELGMEITPTRLARVVRDPRISIDIESDEEMEAAVTILKMRIRRRLTAMK